MRTPPGRRWVGTRRPVYGVGAARPCLERASRRARGQARGSLAALPTATAAQCSVRPVSASAAAPHLPAHPTPCRPFSADTVTPDFTAHTPPGWLLYLWGIQRPQSMPRRLLLPRSAGVHAVSPGAILTPRRRCGRVPTMAQLRRRGRASHGERQYEGGPRVPSVRAVATQADAGRRRQRLRVASCMRGGPRSQRRPLAC